MTNNGDSGPGSGGVTELQANTGTVLNSIPLTTINPNFGIAFDGAHIWINGGTGTPAGPSVVELQASTGAVIGTYPIGGSGAGGVAFDGANIWTANGTTNVVELQASNGYILGTYSLGGTLTNSSGVAFCGGFIWVSGRNAYVAQLQLNGALVGTYPTGGTGMEVACDGAGNLWVTGPEAVSEIQAGTGVLLGKVLLNGVPGSPVSYPTGIASVGGPFMWVADSSSNSVVAVVQGPSPILAGPTYPVGTAPSGVAFDGAYIWVANTGDGTVTKIPLNQPANPTD